MGGGRPPGKGGKGTPHPPTKGGLASQLAREGVAHLHPGRSPLSAFGPATALTREEFLERHRTDLGPPLSSPKSYCSTCRRPEIRPGWLLKMTCSLCGMSLIDPLP